MCSIRHTPDWTGKLFVTDEIKHANPIISKLKQLHGSFCEPELLICY